MELKPTKDMSVRMPREDYEKLEKIAKKEGRPLANLVRSWLLDRLDREEESNGTQTNT